MIDQTHVALSRINSYGFHRERAVCRSGKVISTFQNEKVACERATSPARCQQPFNEILDRDPFSFGAIIDKDAMPQHGQGKCSNIVFRHMRTPLQ
jgi:hypothetical protein